MSTKTYIAKAADARVSICLKLKSGRKTVIFDKSFSDVTYTTANKELQAAIEESNKFKGGQIEVYSETDNKEEPTKAEVKATKVVDDANTYQEANTPQKAKEVLRSEPYNVPFQSIGSVEKIRAKAEELGVSFPNVVWE